MTNDHSKYDEEPVQYCTRCYSLKIGHEDLTDIDYCMDCGCTETAETTIDNWEKMYSGRFGHSYVERPRSPRETIYFRMDLGTLKSRIYRSAGFYRIIRELYPKFPRGLGREESTIVLFDKLSQDGRIDDLRYLLYNHAQNGDYLI